MKTSDIDENKEKKMKKINNNKNNESQFNIQLNILKESRKIKINLESVDKNNIKIIFSNSFSLNDLITLNSFFENFEEPLEAFEYLIQNYNKIDEKKITNINNNKDIKIILPFLISENNNIYEDSIEVILHNITNVNKSASSFISIINNVKKSLEKFNISIKELKSNIDKDKAEKDEKIKELENNFIAKIKEIKNNENSNNISKTTSIIKNYNINDNNYIKNIENIIEEKFDDKMKIFEEKLKILNNKVINLEIRNQNKILDKSKNEESILKDISFNDSILYEKFDKKIQVMNNSMNNKLKKIANKLNMNLKDMELDSSYNNNILENKNNELLDNNDKINESNIKLMNEISNKIKAMNVEIDNKIKNNFESKIKEIINIKIQEIKKEIYSVLNKINDRGKEDYKDLNNKIIALKNDLIKTIDYKYNIIDNKIKIIDGKGNKIIKDNQTYFEKMNYLDIKIKSIDNKFKQMDYKFEDKNKNDMSTNNNLNNSYIIPNSRNILNGSNIINSIDENEINNARNTSFNLSSNLKGKINEKNIDIDSIIIIKEYTNEDYFLFSKIKKVFPSNKILKFNLIYRATRDGDTSKNFHSKCDFIGPNIILIKTKEDYIFGGFTTKSWKHLFKDINKDEPEVGTELKDEKAFCFSINEKKIYNNGKPNEPVIYCNNNYGPVFKNYFKILNECLKNGGLCGKIEESNFEGQEKDYEINGGKEKFDIEELEIFQIGFK